MKEPIPETLATELDVPNSSGEMLSQLYNDLRRLAASRLARERPGQTLQATALVHEAWLRLSREEDRRWNDSKHFFCAAAEVMRLILVENARRKQTLKRGGNFKRVDIDPLDIVAPFPDEQLLAVHDALDGLADENARAAQVVLLRFYAGFTLAQVADQLDLSVATVSRTWEFARAWLFNEIQQNHENPIDVSKNEPESHL